jgi:hypothetical protein
VLAVCWYLRLGLSCRDVEELLVAAGVEVDHVTVYWWSSGSRRCWPMPPGRVGIVLVIADMSTTRM